MREICLCAFQRAGNPIVFLSLSIVQGRRKGRKENTEITTAAERQRRKQTRNANGSAAYEFIIRAQCDFVFLFPPAV